MVGPTLTSLRDTGAAGVRQHLFVSHQRRTAQHPLLLRCVRDKLAPSFDKQLLGPHPVTGEQLVTLELEYVGVGGRLLLILHPDWKLFDGLHISLTTSRRAHLSW